MTLILQPTSSLPQLQFCQSSNFAEWGKLMSLSTYLEREIISYDGEMCQITRPGHDQLHTDSGLVEYFSNGYGVTYWVLRDLSISKSIDPLSTDNIVCACDTVTRPAYYKRKGETKTRQVKAASIGSVFTFPEHRRKGYARKMMDMLVDKFSQYLEVDDEKLNYSILYSEIGEYYSKFQYKSYHCPLGEFKITSLQEGNTKLVEYSPLTEDKFASIVEHYNDKLVKYMDTVDANGSDRDIVSVKPEVGPLKWYMNRAKMTFGDVYGVEYKDISSFGVMLDESNADSGYMYWFYDIGDKSKEEGLHVYITMIHCQSIQGFQRLMMALVSELKRFNGEIGEITGHSQYGFEKVKFWETDLLDCIRFEDSKVQKEQIKDALDVLFGNEVKYGLENGSLSAIRLNQGDMKEVDWLSNGKWCWY